MNGLYHSKPQLEFNPDNPLTRRVRKKFQQESAKQKDDKLFQNLNRDWKPIFESFLKEAVVKLKFPDVDFPNN